MLRFLNRKANLMNKLMIAVCLVVAADLCAAEVTDSPKLSADRQFQKAQQAFTRADEARDSNKPADAIKLYREALESYTKLSSTYPDWQPGVTQFRIAYCQNQLEVLAKKMQTAVQSIPARPLAIPAVTNALPDNATAIPGKAVETIKSPSSETLPRKTRTENTCSESKILIEKGETAKAGKLLLEGLEFDPDNATLRMLMGIVHCRKNEYENAVYLMEPLVKEEPSNTVARVVLGTAYFGLGRTKDAKKQMQEALTINPRLQEAHYNLAQIILTEKPLDTGAAREHYKTALDMGSKPDTNLDLLLMEQTTGK